MSSSNESSSPSGVRLPPISFLSGHSGSNNSTGNRLPSASNLGIFLNEAKEEEDGAYKSEVKREEYPPRQADASITPEYASNSASREEVKEVPRQDAPSDNMGSTVASNSGPSSTEAAKSSASDSRGSFTTPQASSAQSQTSGNGEGLPNRDAPRTLPVTQGSSSATTEESDRTVPVENVSARNELIRAPSEAERSVDKRKSEESHPASGKRTRYVLDKSSILEVLETYFPRMHHLGTIIYNPTTTWLSLRTSQLNLKPEHHERFEEIKRNFLSESKIEYKRQHIKYIPSIPPLSENYINSILEIKIPARFIRAFKDSMDEEGDVVRKRELWGGAGGIYTDDSDILSVLAHLGLFNNNLDLSEWNTKWTKEDIITPLGSDVSNLEFDLSVEVLLLPRLPQYYGFYDNGINSRSWTGKDVHDGLSIGVYNVKWESPGCYLREPGLSKRYQAEVYRDHKISKEHMKENPWKFDYAHYKTLKEKYKNLVQ